MTNLYLKRVADFQLKNYKEPLENSLTNLLKSYSADENLVLRNVNSDVLLLIFSVRSQQIEVQIELREGIPQARVLRPKFAEMDGLLWNGVLVLTSDDLIAAIVQFFSQPFVVIGPYYEDLPLASVFKRIGRPSNSPFSPCIVHGVIDSQIKADEIVVSAKFKSIIMDALKHSDLWYLQNETLFFELESQNLKIIACLASDTHTYTPDAILLSKMLAQNLQFQDGLITMRLVRLPIASELTVWLPDGHVNLQEALTDYSVFTAGTRLMHNDRSIVILKTQAWNNNPDLSLDAVSTVVEGNASTNMRYSISDIEPVIPYKNKDLYEIYQLATKL